MMNHKIVVLTLAAILSGSLLYAVAADSSAGSTSADGKSQTRNPAPEATNADPDAASLPKGADGGTTDNGPTPGGTKASGAGGSSSSSGGKGGGASGG
jgi:hypothetical protein